MSKTMIEPCPFCGSEEVKRISPKPESGVRKVYRIWQVVCLACEARGSSSTVKTIAVARWNSVERVKSDFKN